MNSNDHPPPETYGYSQLNLLWNPKVQFSVYKDPTTDSYPQPVESCSFTVILRNISPPVYVFVSQVVHFL
jgi:hypothetical protein